MPPCYRIFAIASLAASLGLGAPANANATSAASSNAVKVDGHVSAAAADAVQKEAVLAGPNISLHDALAAAGKFSTYLSLLEAAGATQGQHGDKLAAAGATQGQRPGRMDTVSATQGQRSNRMDTVSATQGQRTWLVPNDAAFAALPWETLEALRSDSAKRDAFLALHTLPGAVMVGDMFDSTKVSSKKAFQSTEGHVLGFQCDGHTGKHYPRVGVVALADTAAQRKGSADFPDMQQPARIGETQDVVVSGGVLHELDAVLGAGEAK